MFNQDFLAIQEFMHEYAKRQGHQFVTVEHLLLGLLKDENCVQILEACEADTGAILTALKDYLRDYIPKRDGADPMPTKSLTRVMQRAIWQVQSSQSGEEVAPTDLLVAIFKEDESFANELLQSSGVDILSVMREISVQSRAKMVDYALKGDGDTVDGKRRTSAKENPLDAYTINLNEQAKLGKTDPLIGRADEIERTAQILCRRRKNNPLLVGDPGVGKTAIAEGLAWLIVHNKAPKPLANATIYSLDMGALIAGTKFRGEFEARMKALLDELKQLPDAILFIDEIHMVIGAGSSMDGSMDVSNLIKPALAKGEMRCIGSTTFVEYRQIFEKDHALSRRFQKIDIKEPSILDAIDIIRGLKGYYESFHQVTYTDDAIETAVRLSDKHIHERFLPDKAIDVIDEAGAYLKLHAQADSTDLADNTNQQAAAADENAPKPVVDTALIERIIAKIARIPPKSVSSDDKHILKNLKANLKQVVFGQDEAVDVLTDAILLARSGLTNPDKPIGSFLFAGPTGVGKTEISKQLAKMLGVELIRFDMSEYMEAHTASRLIGAPPGYVGYDQGGLLTEKINQYPHCVLLLDELEKAHSDVFNLLLQVMDHGTLTDNNGRSVSFKQVILVMTTNVGADAISKNSMGFTEQSHHTDNTAAINRTFSPEFRNRLDAIVNFAPLSRAVIDGVVDKFITELSQLLLAKNIILKVDDAVRSHLADKGYDRLMGARPMARLIQDKLKKPLSQMILFGELTDGGTVTAVMQGDEVGFEVACA
ncbi:ATP-dependent Clp protease ATP-binding subunit ClpA [uncultured Moraxella sp.]|uniref:ATP-dependent Clp protease ATP-binding subunit ClpA n=1 Tax=uncultured Moraxella sp. TaxID=263769 RepID=UPI00345C1154